MMGKKAPARVLYVDEEEEVIGNSYPVSYRNIRRKPSGLSRSKESKQKLWVTVEQNWVHVTDPVQNLCTSSIYPKCCRGFFGCMPSQLLLSYA